jgi:mono/diheme cytochrome c family protein
MLRRVDTWLAIGTWIVAGLFVLMLLIGPEVVAEDKGKAAGASAYVTGGGGTDGKQVFTSNCGSCHTLSKAGTTGAVGPKLDAVSLSSDQVEKLVRGGSGVMPPFEGKLSDAEITAVAAYVTGP